jgi:hypothetical protein
MNAPLASSDLRKGETIQTNWLQRAGLFVLFLLCEAVIFILGSHYEVGRSGGGQFKCFPDVACGAVGYHRPATASGQSHLICSPNPGMYHGNSQRASLFDFRGDGHKVSSY